MRDRERIRRVVSGVTGEILWDEPMSRHTTFRVGGLADVLISPCDLEGLKTVVVRSQEEGVPLFALGNGSNLLVRDGGIEGIVVSLSRFSGISVEGERIYVEAGVSCPVLAKTAYRMGLSGLEFACEIPGMVGGALVMNAGTHKGEIFGVVEWIRILTPAGEIQEVDRKDCDYGYRRTRLPAGIIVGASLRLSPGRREEIGRRMEEALAHRRATQPLSLSNAGCIFKNPSGISAGQVIEAVGVKGYRIGDAQVSERHANFIINRGKATAEEILSLISLVRGRVEEERGITLEMEIRIVGRGQESAY